MVYGRSSGIALNAVGLGYFAEFLIFPPLTIVSTAIAFFGPNPPHPLAWAAVFVSGLVVWTLIEYFLHRVFLHHAPFLSALHERHHSNPHELIGTPVWASVLSGIAVVAAPSWLLLGFELATAATTGIATGYLWYVYGHYAAHYGKPREGSYFHRVRLRHARHHHLSDTGNFGVTTEFWDRVFGTTLDLCRIARKIR
ncbi:MAG TPA: sterol desaturase family protein [Xanthobacteraceae bacterium]|jgi:sterol desaturase/sphingolipid hydroxylase (fatty acid hydroxylase superfamily)